MSVENNIMNIKQIKLHNDNQFLLDLKKSTSVMVYVEKTNNYFSILKRELLKEAENSTIKYYMTDKIFTVGRLVMVVI